MTRDEEEAARIAWIGRLVEGDSVGYLLDRGYYGKYAIVTRVKRVTKTLITTESGARFYRLDGKQVGGDWSTRLVWSDHDSILAARIREITQELIRDVETETREYRQRKGHQDPLVLAETIRDLSDKAAETIRDFRRRIDIQHKERQSQ